MELAIRRPFG